MGAGNGAMNGVLNALVGRADKLYDPIIVVVGGGSGLPGQRLGLANKVDGTVAAGGSGGADAGSSVLVLFAAP